MAGNTFQHQNLNPTNRRGVSGRLEWILDTLAEFVTEIICQTSQSSQFPFSGDNHSHPSPNDYQRGALVALCVDTRRQGNKSSPVTSGGCWRSGREREGKSGTLLRETNSTLKQRAGGESTLGNGRREIGLDKR